MRSTRRPPLSDGLVFLRSLLRNPARVSAVAPSGRSLSRLITAEITPESAPIIELGPGTGSFTRALLAREVPEQRLVLIEAEPAFASNLQSRFPRARVVTMDAAEIGAHERFFGRERAGAAVSGLPLVAMSRDKVTAILGGLFDKHLRPDAALYQFTYWRWSTSPVPRAVLEDLGLTSHRIGIALANMPPAAVYKIHRATPEQR